MKTSIRNAALALVLGVLPALSLAAMPRNGITMQEVEMQAGAPKSKSAPVGQPPITRWDYDGYSVYFENNRVLHTVKQD